MRNCVSCQKPMPFGARVCTNCGYDRVARERNLTRVDAEPERTSTPVFSPFAVAGWILLAVAVAAPLVWKQQLPTLIYAGAAGLLLLITGTVQFVRALSCIGRDDLPGAADVLLSGRSSDPASYLGREVFWLMFSEETEGRFQMAFFAAIVAGVAAACLLAAAFR